MLKYSINKDNLNLTLNSVNYSGVTLEGEKILFNNLRHYITNDSIVKFMRLKNGIIYYDDIVKPQIVDDKLIIKKFGEYTVYPTAVKNVTGFTMSDIETGNTYNALFIYFLETPHPFFNEDRNIIIKEYGKKACVGDYVVYDNKFLRKVKTISDDRIPTTFESEILNIKEEKISLNVSGETITLSDCIVPINNYGLDNRNLLIWVYDTDDEETVESVMNKWQYGKWSVEDTRYYNINENGIITLKPNANLYVEEGHPNIFIPIEEQIEYNMHQRDAIESQIDNIIEESMNTPIDMEKQIFYPVIPEKNNSGETIGYNNVEGINFNLKFRKRDDGVTDVTEMDNIISAWENDNIGNEWYGTEIDNDTFLINENEESDLLSHLGFTDDDIYYRKKCLKKSFIRLTFYDTNDPKTQSLLFYSTIFFNTGELYGKYIKNVVKNDKDEKERISATFSIKNIHDRFNSSEGFYLYLFPNLCKGTSATTLYMKIEFNHAKFGKRVPLSVTHNNQIKPYYIGDEGEDYSEKMRELLSDLYIPIKIKYDEENYRYIWYIENNNNDNIVSITDNMLNFTYYEPVINKESN